MRQCWPALLTMLTLAAGVGLGRGVGFGVGLGSNHFAVEPVVVVVVVVAKVVVVVPVAVLVVIVEVVVVVVTVVVVVVVIVVVVVLVVAVVVAVVVAIVVVGVAVEPVQDDAPGIDNFFGNAAPIWLFLPTAFTRHSYSQPAVTGPTSAFRLEPFATCDHVPPTKRHSAMYSTVLHPSASHQNSETGGNQTKIRCCVKLSYSSASSTNPGANAGRCF